MVERVNLQRLAANAREAAEQTERLSVPEVAEPLALPSLLAEWPVQRSLLVCAEGGPAVPLADHLAGITPGAAGPAAILIGPEGGFEERELEMLARHPGAVTVSLGPRILRADTAALAALACWQAWAGDWRAEEGARPRFHPERFHG